MGESLQIKSQNDARKRSVNLHQGEMKLDPICEHRCWGWVSLEVLAIAMMRGLS